MTTAEGPVPYAIRVRYHECDMQGVAFNASYITYADMASFELWRAVLGSYERLCERGFETMVVACRATFRSPARYDDELQLEVGVPRIGNTSFDVLTRITRSDEQLAEVVVTYVFVDRESWSAAAPPEDVRELLRLHPIDA